MRATDTFDTSPFVLSFFFKRFLVFSCFCMFFTLIGPYYLRFHFVP